MKGAGIGGAKKRNEGMRCGPNTPSLEGTRSRQGLQSGGRRRGQKERRILQIRSPEDRGRGLQNYTMRLHYGKGATGRPATEKR